jgi:hypothetical protein
MTYRVALRADCSHFGRRSARLLMGVLPKYGAVVKENDQGRVSLLSSLSYTSRLLGVKPLANSPAMYDKF